MNTLMVVDIVILSFSLIVLSYFVHVNHRMPEGQKKALYLAIFVEILSASANVYASILNGDPEASHILHGLFKALELGFYPMLFLLLGRLARRDSKEEKYLAYLFGLNVILELLSVWTGWIFTIDAENLYHAGPLISVAYICSILGFVYLVYVYYMLGKSYRNSHGAALIMIMGFLCVGIIIRSLYTNLPVTYVCAMPALTLIYIYLDDFRKQVQDEEIAAQMSVMDTLTVNFECVYKVDVQTHFFEALRVSKFIGKQLGGKLTPETTYEAGMELYCRLNVFAEDQEMFRDNTRMEHILENLKEEKSYSFGYRILRDGKTMFFNMSAYKMLEDDKITHLLIGFADVDEQRRRWENLMKISTTDQMTGLYNRRAYNEELERIDQLPASEKSLVEAVMIDINGLKQTNDTYGHLAGDELIVDSANLMKAVYGKVGKVFRMGGDEFVVIASLEKKDSDACLKKFKDAMAEWKGAHIDHMSAAVGVARIDETENEIPMEEIIKTADARMYQNKAAYYQLHDRKE